MTKTPDPIKAKFPNVCAMLPRLLGKDRKGLAHITRAKTLQWLEVQQLLDFYTVSHTIEDTESPQVQAFKSIISNLDARVAELEAELAACTNRSAGLERLVAAGRMAGDAWMNERASAVTPQLRKALDRLAMIAGTVIDTTPEETTP